RTRRFLQDIPRRRSRPRPRWRPSNPARRPSPSPWPESSARHVYTSAITFQATSWSAPWLVVASARGSHGRSASPGSYESQPAGFSGHHRGGPARRHVIREGADARFGRNGQPAKPEHLATAFLTMLGQQRRGERAARDVEVSAARVHRELQISV